MPDPNVIHRLYAEALLANCPPTMKSFRPYSKSVLTVYAKNANSPLAYLSNPCWPSPLKPLAKFWTDSRTSGSPANTNTTVKGRRYAVHLTFSYIFVLIYANQVHKLEDGTVRVFSRNSEDMSKKYPDLVEQLPKVRTSPTHGGFPVLIRFSSASKNRLNPSSSMQRPLRSIAKLGS